jgi:hypothetical protein
MATSSAVMEKQSTLIDNSAWLKKKKLKVLFQLLGRAKVQEICRRPASLQSRFLSQRKLCEICGEEYGTETGFSPRTLIFSFQLSFQKFSIPVHLLSTGWTMGPLQGVVPQE